MRRSAPPMWVAAIPVAAVTATHLLNSPPCRCRSALMMRFSRNDLPAQMIDGTYCQWSV